MIVRFLYHVALRISPSTSEYVALNTWLEVDAAMVGLDDGDTEFIVGASLTDLMRTITAFEAVSNTPSLARKTRVSSPLKSCAALTFTILVAWLIATFTL